MRWVMKNSNQSLTQAMWSLNSWISWLMVSCIQRDCSLCYAMLCYAMLSHFSHVRLCVTPQTAAHQAPPSLGFSRQEHWSGLPFPSPMHESESEVAQLCPTLSDPMDCSLPGSSVHGIFQARVLEWGAIAFSVPYAKDNTIMGRREVSDSHTHTLQNGTRLKQNIKKWRWHPWPYWDCIKRFYRDFPGGSVVNIPFLITCHTSYNGPTKYIHFQF